MDATTPLKVMETCYTYDSMERLIKEKVFNSAVTSYGFMISAGNRTLKARMGRTEKYFYNRNQLTELHREKNVVRYSYDPAV